jgi:hypothetical protein
MSGETHGSTVGRVFVPGGRPTVTYVPRDELRLEGRIDDYLAEGFRILSVSGPTKTGKTVLLQSRVQNAIWLSGGAIESADDFWQAIVDELGIETELGPRVGNGVRDVTRDVLR